MLKEQCIGLNPGMKGLQGPAMAPPDLLSGGSSLIPGHKGPLLAPYWDGSGGGEHVVCLDEAGVDMNDLNYGMGGGGYYERPTLESCGGNRQAYATAYGSYLSQVAAAAGQYVPPDVIGRVVNNIGSGRYSEWNRTSDFGHDGD